MLNLLGHFNLDIALQEQIPYCLLSPTTPVLGCLFHILKQLRSLSLFTFLRGCDDIRFYAVDLKFCSDPTGVHAWNRNTQYHSRQTLDTHWTAGDCYLIRIERKYIHAIENNTCRLAAKKTSDLASFIRRDSPVDLHQRITQKKVLAEYTFFIDKCPV